MSNSLAKLFKSVLPSNKLKENLFKSKEPSAFVDLAKIDFNSLALDIAPEISLVRPKSP